jgi:transcriptional regulator with XRE-family HTH domain
MVLATQDDSNLRPEDIRRIRQSLGLSRAEAGELLGGGPRAFTKYETGQIQPTAAISNLLRLLEANPSAGQTLIGRKTRPIDSDGAGLLRVTGQHITVLSDRKLALLARRVLAAEAQGAELPRDGVHVAAKITVADDGEDARIQWSGGPDRTAYLPARLCQFQLKATDVAPTAAAADICTSAGEIEPEIRRVLEQGGAYIVLCSRSLTQKQIRARQERLIATLRAASVALDSNRVQFRDADQIAEWVNAHPSVAAWVLQQTQPGLTGPFREWSHWAGRHEHERSSWVDDKRLPAFRDALRAEVIKARSVVRVLGYAGIGKSRLTLEALGATEAEDANNVRLSDLVLYAVESESSTTDLKSVVQNLADSSLRAIVVVDRCAPDTHMDLAAIVKRSESRVSLITIDHEMPHAAVSADQVLTLEGADEAVIDGILKQRTSTLPSEDHRRLMKLAEGYPLMAVLVGQAWNNGEPVSSATDETVINAIIFGRKPLNAELLLDASLRLSAFGRLGAKPPAEDDLVVAAKFGRHWSTDDFRSAFEDLASRGVVQSRGRLITLQPRPVALALAERQWKQWGPERWDEVLAGSVPTHLRVAAARRLALLNDKAIAAEVVGHLCRLDGPLNSVAALCSKGAMNVLSLLAEVNANSVVKLLEHVMNQLSVEEFRAIQGDVRRSLVRALQKIAFVEKTFEPGAWMLLKLAVAENETWASNATGVFKALFPVLGGDTQASARARLQVLDEALNCSDPRQLAIAVDAVLAGAQTQSFIRIVGAETHGSRPVLEPWRPGTWPDAWDYVIECLNRVSHIARRTDAIGAHARSRLGHTFRHLVASGQIDVVERLVHEVTRIHPYWPDALNTLGDVLQYDSAKTDPALTQRVRRLIAMLKPNHMADRVRYLVTQMPWDYPEDEPLEFEARGERQREAVRQLVTELLARPETVAGFIPQLCRGNQRMAFEFGSALAELSSDRLLWRDPILRALEGVPEKERNFHLLTGYFARLSKFEPGATQEFKELAWNSSVFAPALPLVCWSMHITEADIQLVCSGLANGAIRPSDLGQWQTGGILAKLPTDAVAPLFDQLLELKEGGFAQAVGLMTMYTFQERQRLEGLRPQLRQMASITIADSGRGGSASDAYHFEELLGWILEKGPSDADARWIAMTLAKRLAADEDDNAELIRPLVPTLLSSFAETTWPILGQAIVTDRAAAWHLEHALGDVYAFDKEKKPPILLLPEDLLFGWCHANPDAAPAFVAAIMPTVINRAAPPSEQQFHSLAIRLLNEFGDRDSVLTALTRNMHTFGWSGSREGYFALFDRPLRELESHPIGLVRRWAKGQLAQFSQEIASVRNEEQERAAEWDL